jgi:thymidylate kinase
VGTAIRRVFKGEFGKPSKEASFYLAAAEHNEFLNELKKIHTAYAFDVDHIHVLIQDRHSAVSGWAYQVCGSGVDKDLWRRVYSDYRNWPYPQDPDCIVLYYPSLATIMNRIKSRGEPSDHFEQQEFLAKVVKGYETVGVAGVLPSHLYIHESGESSLEVEYKTLIHDLAGYLEERVQHIDGERQELQLLFSKLDAI